VRDEHSAFAGRQCFGAVKREGPERTQRPCALARVRRADRFGRVLDDGNAMAASDVEQSVHFADAAVQMRRDDCLGARRDCDLDFSRVKAPGVGQDVDQDRGGAHMDDRRSRCDPVDVGQNYFIARTDAECGETHMHRARAARGGNRIRDPQKRRKAFFEAIDVFVASFPPAVCGGVRRIADFEFADRGFGVVDTGHAVSPV
jgi:hypothetical protein